MVNYSTCVSAEEICEGSSKLITFIDLAGHQKYLKTTVFGLTAHCPDLAMLVVGANSGVGECIQPWIHDWTQNCCIMVPVAQQLCKPANTMIFMSGGLAHTFDSNTSI